MTISRRLVLATSVAVATTVALGSAATYVVVRHELRDQVDSELRATRPELPPMTDTEAPEGGRTLRLTVRKDRFGGTTGIAQIIKRRAGRAEPVGEGPLPEFETAVIRDVVAGRRESAFADERVSGVNLRVFATRTAAGDILQVARPLTEVDHTLSWLLWVLVLVTLGGVGLAAGLGVAVARGTLRPVRRLSASAAEVARTQDLEHRLPIEGQDELSRLATSFNTMLAALGRSREAQRALVADASHELRTPLTSARTNIALLDRAPDLDPAERGRVVTAVGEQLSELTVLVDDLVDLARDSEQQQQSEREDVRLDLLTADAVRSAQRHAPNAEITLAAQPCVVNGVPARIDRAVRNLLDNALKHGPADAPVEVSVRDGVVSVRDHGRGIAPDDLPHVFDRFYRAPSARGLPGSGLGLAIVRQVAETHGGSVRASDAPGGGALLELSLPLSRSS